MATVNPNNPDSIVSETLGMLRDQQDAQQYQQQDGRITFNPSVFQFSTLGTTLVTAKALFDSSRAKRYVVLGPFKFDQRFTAAPRILFGEVAQFLTAGSVSDIPIGTATNYIPFTVQVQVFKYTYLNGEVDGFYAGLYAVTAPPSGIVNHIVDWVAIGKASRYGDTGQSEGWTEDYDYNEPEFLEDDVTDIQPYYDEEDYVE